MKFGNADNSNGMEAAVPPKDATKANGMRGAHSPVLELIVVVLGAVADLIRHRWTLDVGCTCAKEDFVRSERMPSARVE